MTYSTIPKSHLEGALRLDPEYYQPEYLRLDKIISSLPPSRLGDIAYITDGEHGSPIFDKTSNIRYFSAQHVKDCIIEGLDAKTISKIIDNRNVRSRLKAGDILISTVGTIGFAGMVTEDLLPANIDRHVARIALKDKTLSPEFLVAFLNSEFGRFQSMRETTGNVQLNLFIDKIKELKVPKNDDPKVIKAFKSGLENLEKSKSLYSQAEDLLLEELGIKDLKLEEDLTFTTTLKDCMQAGRIDPDFFQPKYEKIISKIKVKKEKLVNLVKRQNDIIKISKGEHYKYIEIRDVNVGNGEASFNTIESQDLPANAKMKLEGGELIISKVRPTRGAIAIIPNQWNNNFIASGAFSVFKTESPLREYLFLVLRTQIGKMQFEKPTTGTSYPTITDEDVENVVIPILPLKTQEKIANLVNESFKLRKEAKDLLEEAKKRVEEEIEKS